MIYKVFEICLRLRVPSTKGKDLDFSDKADDIIKSANEFNNKFGGWSKTLIVSKINPERLHLILIIEKEKKKVSTRDIRSFTAYLYHEMNWNIYSREVAKLFEGIVFKEMLFSRFREALIEENKYINEKLKTKFLKQVENYENEINEIENKKIISPILDTEINDEISDEQTLAVLNYLLKTKNLGKDRLKKTQTISRIKNMLLEWV